MEHYGTYGTMSIWDVWKPKERQIDLNPGNGQEGGKYSNLQQYSVWEIVTTWMQINTAEVPDFRNLDQGY